MARQLPLSFRRLPSYRACDFAPGGSNAEARKALDAWPAWPGGVEVLVGPEGVGKTHLARMWAERARATVLDRRAPEMAPGRPALLEDADRGLNDEVLFHLLNIAQRDGSGLLLTARTAPVSWPAALPDLRSRLNALPVALIEPPDDAVLTGLLEKFFRERSIRPTPEVYPYLLARMERSAPQAWEIVSRLDEIALEQQRPVSRALAREVLEGSTENLDLFE